MSDRGTEKVISQKRLILKIFYNLQFLNLTTQQLTNDQKQFCTGPREERKVLPSKKTLKNKIWKKVKKNKKVTEYSINDFPVTKTKRNDKQLWQIDQVRMTFNYFLLQKKGERACKTFFLFFWTSFSVSVQLYYIFSPVHCHLSGQRLKIAKRITVQ
jgi:hypothetical protein